MEETGFSYDLEVEMIEHARELGLFTSPYVYNEIEAEKMAKAGADVLVAHMGLTTKGTIGSKSAQLIDVCVEKIQSIHDAAKSINPNILVICHGGPISEPEDAAYVFSKTKGIVGFFGASSIERLPTEKAIKEQVIAFKNVKI
jgi:predicted TIM-barrel enzyme